MGRVADAFWRATAYCFHPRVIALSLAPLLTSAAVAFALGWFFWESAVSAVRATLDSWQLIDTLLHYLSFIGADGFRAALAPIVVLVLAVPLVVIVSLLLVALLMSPALVRMVAARRFATLEKRRGGAWWRGLFWALGHGVLALFLLALSTPLWLIPPLVLIVPPLIWGWLGYRVFAYDVLAEHATVEERQSLLREHRVPMLFMGVVSGYASAAPAAIWAYGGITAIGFAPLLIIVSVWLYTLVFAFSTLWFAHYALASLAEQRSREAVIEDAVRVVASAPEAPALSATASLPPLLP